MAAIASTAAAEPSTPADPAPTEQLPQYVALPLDHPISATDAVALASSVEQESGIDVYGFRHEQPRLQGEYYFDSGQSVVDFLEGFDEDFGTAPEVVALLAVIDASETPTIASSEAASITRDDSASVPGFSAPPASGDEDELESLLDRYERTQQDSAEQSNALLASPTWFPSYNEIYAVNALIGGSAGRRVATYSIWGGGSGNTPAIIPDDWGIEIETRQYNDALIGTRPACATGVNMAFWANKGTGPTGIYSYAVYGQLGPLDQVDIGSYWDWADALDACSDQSLSVGIGYANELANVANDPATGIVVVQTVINTSAGTKTTSPMSANIQAVSNDCNNVGRGPAADCMGLNTDRDFPLTPQNHSVSGKTNGYTFPNCLYTHWDAPAQIMNCP